MEALLSGTMSADIAAPLEAGFRSWRAGALEEAQRHLERALSLAQGANDMAGQISARHLLANLAFERGELEAARELHAAVLVTSLAYDFAVGVASSLHNLGLVSARQGARPVAYQQIADAVSLYLKLGHRAGAANARNNLRRLTRGPCPQQRRSRVWR